MKYKVSNCPVIHLAKGTCNGGSVYCENNPDCPIKKVIEKCKSIEKDSVKDSHYNPVAFAKYTDARQLLNLFKVTEIGVAEE